MVWDVHLDTVHVYIRTRGKNGGCDVEPYMQGSFFLFCLGRGNDDDRTNKATNTEIRCAMGWQRGNRNQFET